MELLSGNNNVLEEWSCFLFRNVPMRPGCQSRRVVIRHRWQLAGDAAARRPDCSRSSYAAETCVSRGTPASERPRLANTLTSGRRFPADRCSAGLTPLAILMEHPRRNCDSWRLLRRRLAIRTDASVLASVSPTVWLRTTTRHSLT